MLRYYHLEHVSGESYNFTTNVLVDNGSESDTITRVVSTIDILT
jgi:hypothetical protein